MRPYHNNPRKISNEQLSDLDTWLRELGDLSGIVHDLNSDEIIGGNQRARVFDLVQTNSAAITVTETFDPPTPQGTVGLGYISWNGERYGYRQVRWTPERAQQANVVANRAGGDWDWDILKDFDFGDLLDWGFTEQDFELAGVDFDNGTPALDDPGPQLDKAAELQEKWQVSTGDVWQCGEHFTVCGDCREPGTWKQLLTVARVDKANGIFTSPPYAEQRKKQYGGIPTAEYVDWWEAVQANVKAHLAIDGSFFVNIKPHCESGERVLYVFDLVLAMKRQWGWRYIEESVWKHGGTPGRPATRFKNQFEPIHQFSLGSYKWRPDNAMEESNGAFLPAGRPNVSKSQGHGGSTLDGVRTFTGLVYPGNVIVTGKNQDAVGHPAAFPTALPARFIRAYSDPGDVWLDPFLGSGTTIVAAHQNKRRGLGIEKLEKYCAVTLERVFQLGLDPHLIQNA